MRIFGHRGAPREATENTLGAFEAARRAGCDGVELDVRLCATGELVVCHDATLLRLAGASVRVRATGWDTLRRMALRGDARIPLLSQVLELWAGHGAVNIEIKTDDGDGRALARAVVETVKAQPRTEVMVSSFDPDVLVGLRAMRPTLRRGMLVPRVASYPTAARGILARTAAVAPHAMHPWYGDVRPAWVQHWRALGTEVNVWTVDDLDAARELASMGVSSVITNVPGVLVPAINRSSVGVEGNDPHGSEVWNGGFKGRP